MGAIIDFVQFHAFEFIANFALFLMIFTAARLAKASELTALCFAALPVSMILIFGSPQGQQMLTRILPQ